MATEIQPVRIFIAYAHEDDASREKLRRQLSVLERRGHFHIFWDGLIKPGERWDERLKDELHRADIFLLLVSEFFLDSEYVHEVELPKALALRNEGKAEVLPVILRNCLWQYTELTDFQCILCEGRPVEDANGYAQVATIVAETARQINDKRANEAREKQEAAKRARDEKAETRQKTNAAQAAREQQLREQADHDAWEFAEEADTEASYRKYLNKYPRGLHAAAAQAGLDVFEKKREEALAVEAQRKRKEEETKAAATKAEAAKKNDPFADLMIYIKGGAFDMGDTFGDGSDSEKPVHHVTVKDFQLCKYPVTQAQWKAIMGDNPSNFKGDDLPVERVSWDDAQKFIKKLNEKTGKKYRLPSEAEWEYAAREGGKKVRFGNGKDIAEPKEINFDGRKDYKQSYSVVGEYRKKTTPVDSFVPNALGLHDMSGNVWEWCADHWHENYQGAPDDGSAWTSGGDSSLRVVRGGSWYISPYYCRAACRYRDTSAFWSNGLGFRLAR